MGDKKMAGKEPEIFCKEADCYAEQGKCGEECEYCFVNVKKSGYTRKCFMTGEYCSKQTSINREREELHKKDCINAFVVMSFSDMADVVYKWRIKPFIEKLKANLAFDKNREKICCFKGEIKDEADEKVEQGEEEKEKRENKNKYHKIKEIYVERADTDIASNYVMCSRVCQRMQVADLVVVDVSHQNPNVFYELGLAIALGKLVLPICFSESYYKMDVPKMVKETDRDYKIIEHHIGSYPWRKELFEYYGIFRKKNEEKFTSKIDEENQPTHYMKYEKATDVRYRFSDMQYSRFPYDAEIIKKDEGTGEKKEKIGEKLYDELRENYNSATKKDNTLLVYTMDGFLNVEEAGICIVNFYHIIVAKLQEELCFCGDRVGVLVQKNGVWEEDKDSEKEIDLFYEVGEIIHIGVNEATYLAEEERIKTDDVTASQEIGLCGNKSADNGKITKKQRDEILRAVKEYNGNRGIIIYPQNPVYVKRELDRFRYTEAEEILNDENILKKAKKEGKKSSVCYCTNNNIKTLYHKTLHALRYVNEVVIDVSYNSIQALFWLGVAHGSSVNAIIVSYESSEKERQKENKEKKIRMVFDVAGLWSAILRSNDTQGFYGQLAQAQYGIEHHAKLMLKDKNIHEKKLYDAWRGFGKNFESKSIEEIYDDEKKEIMKKLESFYRSCFWNAMLRHNQLLICMSQIEQSVSGNDEARGYTSKWDFRASALLSHYLSKRTVISEYRIKALNGEEEEKKIKEINFISLGSNAKPLGESLSQYIINDKTYTGKIHEYYDGTELCTIEGEVKKKNSYRGFREIYSSEGKRKEDKKGYFTQHPYFSCCNTKEGKCGMDLPKNNNEKDWCKKNIDELRNCECTLYETTEHDEIAQLLIWRDNVEKFHEKNVFRVAVNGSSGPATLALSSLLVGEEQRKEIFYVNEESKKKLENAKEEEREKERKENKDNNLKEDDVKFHGNLLYDLQEKIRAKFMEEYWKDLSKKIKNILRCNEINGIKFKDAQIDRYMTLVKYAISIYLYNELYRYFFPILSDKDVYSLYNGITNFLNYMRSGNESPFSMGYPQKGDEMYQCSIADEHVTEIIEKIPECLLSLLKNFRGIEVFYRVRVKHDLIQEVLGDSTKEEEDSREILEIEFLEKEDYIHLLFCENKKEEKDGGYHY